MTADSPSNTKVIAVSDIQLIPFPAQQPIVCKFKRPREEARGGACL